MTDGEPVDVHAILASLSDELADPGDDPWGGANLGWCCAGDCECAEFGAPDE